MYDLIAIGDITVDLFFKGESFTQKDDRFLLAIGGKYSASYFYESLGGGGANVAVGCAHFGFNCAVIGTVGENPFKQMIIQKLVKKRVSCEFLNVEKDYLNISTILLNELGGRTIIHYCPHHNSNKIGTLISQQTHQSKIVYLGNLPHITPDERQKWLMFFKEQSSIICLSLGISDCRKGVEFLKKLLLLADILILNTHEFSELVKKKITDINFNNSQTDFIQFDKKQVLILTDAEKGSYGYYEGEVFYQKALSPKKIVDTTGAGDAFTSGFLSSYIVDKNIQKGMHNGAVYASIILSRIGAQ